MVLAVVVALLTPCAVFAQFSPKIDSLIAIAECAPDSVAAARNNDVCWKLRNINPEIAIRFGMKAIDLAKQRNDYEQLVKGYAFVGVCQRNLDNYADALEYYRLGIDNAKKYGITDQLGYGYVNLGNLLIHEHKYDEAEQELQKALPIAESINDSAVLGYVCLNLGRTRLGNNDFENAEKYLLRSIEIRTKCKALNSQINVSRKYLADCHAAAGEKVRARNEYMTTLANADLIGDFDLLSELTYNIAQQYFEDKRYDSALVYASQSLVYAKHLGSKNSIMLAYGMIADVYHVKGDNKRLAETYKEQVDCNDSIFKSNLQLKLFNIQYSADSYNKQLEYESLTEQKNVQKRLTIVSCVILLLVIVALTSIYLKGKKVKKLNLQLESQKDSLATINGEITASINYARRIQLAALNTDASVMQVFPDSMIYYRPKEIVSGDWYRVEERGGLKIVIESDCTGMGVPGSLLSMMGISVFKDVINALAISGDEMKADVVLERMRGIIKAMLAKNSGDGISVDSGMDASLAIIDPVKRVMSFAAACQTALMVRGDEVIRLVGDDMPIGNHKNEVPFAEQQVVLRQGDEIFFMNGGVRNLRNVAGERFFNTRLPILLAENHGLPMQELSKILDGEINAWRGGKGQDDDMTILGFRIQ